MGAKGLDADRIPEGAAPPRLRGPGTFVADLHVHSRFAMGCSPALTLPNLAQQAKRKGIDLLATGDFTHPAWSAELRAGLTDCGDGLFEHEGVRFVLGTEISCVFKQDGKGRRVHLLVMVSSWKAVERLTEALGKLGRLDYDGRAMVRLSCEETAALVLNADPEAILIPAHVWTPWYALFGSKSGFDDIARCFGSTMPYVRAVETGLSSDPAMNRLVPQLDSIPVVSFSDAHSLDRLGREATVFRADLSYHGLGRALSAGDIVMTIETFPEHGKYHLDGHRACGIRFEPWETSRVGGRCTKCHKPLTVGVLSRVMELADEDRFAAPIQGAPFVSTLPLDEIVGAVRGKGARTRGVRKTVETIVSELGPELDIIVDTPVADVRRVAGDEIAGALHSVRQGTATIEPGYDGQYGRFSAAAG